VGASQLRILRSVKRPLIAVAAVVIMILSGCSIPETAGGRSGVPDLTPSVSPAAYRAAAANASSAEAANRVLVPDLEGLSLSHANALLKFSGLKSKKSDASAADRKVGYSVQWKVVGQEPSAGVTVKTGKKVELLVVKRDERPDEVLEMSAREVKKQFSGGITLDYLGLTVKEARDRAERADSELRFRDKAGDEIDSSAVGDKWVVVAQEDLPGSGASKNVFVRAVRPSAREVDRIPKQHPESFEGVTRYFGVVTGFETEDPNDYSVANVLIDGAVVPMVFIQPFAAACKDNVDATSAVADRNRVLPIGTKVVATALTSGYWNEGGFVRPVAQLNPADPFADSTNEQLVRLGSWVPDIPGIFESEFDLTTATGPTYVTNPSAYEGLTPIAQGHLLRIIDAGNWTAGQQLGPVGECVVAAIAEARVRAQSQADQKAALDAWEIEYQRRKDAGEYRTTGRCRDGDGDGVCGEGR
jgi:hypothetical protein